MIRQAPVSRRPALPLYRFFPNVFPVHFFPLFREYGKPCPLLFFVEWIFMFTMAAISRIKR
jgi:hypothetical protein